NPLNQFTMQQATGGAQSAAGRLGVDIIVLNASTGTEIEAAFANAVERKAAALLAEDAYFESQRSVMARLGAHHALPTMANSRDGVVAGMLMSYGASIPDFYRQAGLYVGRILKGERPADLPVVQPTKFELIINLKTAKAL